MKELAFWQKGLLPMDPAATVGDPLPGDLAPLLPPEAEGELVPHAHSARHAPAAAADSAC